MQTLRISLLGEIHVDYEGSHSAIALTPGLQLLLAYFVSHRHKCHPRLSLIDQFWPGFSEKRAQRCLRTALWRLKQAMALPGESTSPCLLSTPAHEIQFNSDIAYWLDVEQFEIGIRKWQGKILTEAAADELESVLKLYKGDFLNGHYEDWIIFERERLESMYINGLFQLMDYYKSEQLFDKGLICGQKILRVDLLREEIHREIMRIYNATGRRALAIRQYNQCALILKKELGIEPMPETQNLYQQLLGNGAALPASEPDLSQVTDGAQQRLQKAMIQFEKAFQQLQQATAFLYTEDQNG